MKPSEIEYRPIKPSITQWNRVKPSKMQSNVKWNGKTWIKQKKRWTWPGSVSCSCSTAVIMKGPPKSSTHTGWKGTLIVSLFIYFFISPYHALHRSTSPENRNKRTQVNPPFLLLLFRRLATFAFIFGGRFFFGEILDFFLAMNGDWLIFFYFLGLFFLRRTTAYQSRNPCTGWRLNVENVKKKNK